MLCCEVLSLIHFSIFFTSCLSFFLFFYYTFLSSLLRSGEEVAVVMWLWGVVVQNGGGDNLSSITGGAGKIEGDIGGGAVVVRRWLRSMHIPLSLIKDLVDSLMSCRISCVAEETASYECMPLYSKLQWWWKRGHYSIDELPKNSVMMMKMMVMILMMMVPVLGMMAVLVARIMKWSWCWGDFGEDGNIMVMVVVNTMKTCRRRG